MPHGPPRPGVSTATTRRPMVVNAEAGLRHNECTGQVTVEVCLRPGERFVLDRGVFASTSAKHERR
jgi:hypothetical protein